MQPFRLYESLKYVGINIFRYQSFSRLRENVIAYDDIVIRRVIE